jgi:hypothetical protein
MLGIITAKRIATPAVWIPVALLAVAAIVRPWGDYPLNDDWQYARIVKRLAETGRFFVDVDVAPSLVGQAWIAAPFVKVFGFSHVLLRTLTVAGAAGLLWILDRIFQLAGANRTLRVLGVALIVANPIVLHLAFSFMTEVYGYALALLGALVWLTARSRPREANAPIVSWRAAFAAATLIGASFWIRQFSIAVFPALVAAGVLHQVLATGRRPAAASLTVVAAATAWFAIVVLLYFAWARTTGNYVTAFSTPMRSLLHIDPSLIAISSLELGAYLTLFLWPLLMLERWRDTRWVVFAGVAAVMAVGITVARGLQPSHASFHHHVHFPFSANVVHDTGVGPITFTTTYWDSTSPRPRWPAGVWTAIEWMLVGGMVLWARVVSGAAVQSCENAGLKSGATELKRRATNVEHAAEIRTFGLLLAGIGFALCVQAYQWQVLDRYYLPCLFGVTIALVARAAPRPAPKRPWLALAAAAPLAWFSIAGLHDYFRWNDARWQAVAIARSAGASPQVIDGGFEVNGWLNYDAATHQAKPAGCVGACACAPLAFYCTDDSYTISMELPAGRRAVATLPVSWWLAAGPDVILSRRERPVATLPPP